MKKIKAGELTKDASVMTERARKYERSKNKTRCLAGIVKGVVEDFRESGLHTAVYY